MRGCTAGVFCALSLATFAAFPAIVGASFGIDRAHCIVLSAGAVVLWLSIVTGALFVWSLTNTAPE